MTPARATEENRNGNEDEDEDRAQAEQIRDRAVDAGAPRRREPRRDLKALGWQPHSARAAISGLRKAGYGIERNAPEGETTGSVYRITSRPEAAA